jgi:hypothetical protein
MFEFKARKSDNSWLKKTDFGRALVQEKLQIQKILNEVRGRVEARKSGIQAILGI